MFQRIKYLLIGILYFIIWLLMIIYTFSIILPLLDLLFRGKKAFIIDIFAAMNDGDSYI